MLLHFCFKGWDLPQRKMSGQVQIIGSFRSARVGIRMKLYYFCCEDPSVWLSSLISIL